MARKGRRKDTVTRFLEEVSQRARSFRIAPHAVEQDDVGHGKVGTKLPYFMIPSKGVVRKRRV